MEIKGLDLSPTVSMLDGIQESLQANQNAMIASMRIANQAKEVPVSWITPDHHDVTAEMIAYLKPLVAGEVPTDYADGIADYLDVSHLTKVYGK